MQPLPSGYASRYLALPRFTEATRIRRMLRPRSLQSDQRLRLRVELHPDESLSGFAFRLAIRNAMRPGELARELGLPLGFDHMWLVSPLGRDYPIQRLARLSGVPLKTLGLALPWYLRVNRRAVQSYWAPRVGGGALADVRPLRRICPECLRASPHQRQAWDVAQVPSVCLHHRVWLLHSCQQCRQPISWGGENLHRCAACGWDMRASPVRRCTDDAFRVTQFIHGCLIFGRLIDPPEFLAEYDPLLAFEALHFIMRAKRVTASVAFAAFDKSQEAFNEWSAEMQDHLPDDLAQAIAGLIERARDDQPGGTEYSRALFASVRLLNAVVRRKTWSVKPILRADEPAAQTIDDQADSSAWSSERSHDESRSLATLDGLSPGVQLASILASISQAEEIDPALDLSGELDEVAALTCLNEVALEAVAGAQGSGRLAEQAPMQTQPSTSGLDGDAIKQRS